jgi:hypothetical protein
MLADRRKGHKQAFGMLENDRSMTHRDMQHATLHRDPSSTVEQRGGLRGGTEGKTTVELPCLSPDGLAHGRFQPDGVTAAWYL